MGAELLRADGRTDNTLLIAVVYSFANAPKNSRQLPAAYTDKCMSFKSAVSCALIT
jgi:hypothetical protein